jgi:predicted regulator of Ras-like GTPase activity (Roadblock/LC7/MglB family)
MDTHENSQQSHNISASKRWLWGSLLTVSTLSALTLATPAQAASSAGYQDATVQPATSNPMVSDASAETTSASAIASISGSALAADVNSSAATDAAVTADSANTADSATSATTDSQTSNPINTSASATITIAVEGQTTRTVTVTGTLGDSVAEAFGYPSLTQYDTAQYDVTTTNGVGTFTNDQSDNVTITITHKHVYTDFEHSGLTTQRTITFDNVPADADGTVANQTQTVKWATDTDLVTQQTTYIPMASAYIQYVFHQPTDYDATSNDVQLTSSGQNIIVTADALSSTTTLPTNRAVIVTFTPALINGQIVFFDDDRDGEQVVTIEFSGYTNSLQFKIPTHYVVTNLPVVLAQLRDSDELAFNSTAIGQNMTFNVYLKHQLETTTQSKTITVTIANNQAQKNLTFTRTATTDLVTNQTSVSDWTTDDQFSSLTTDDGLTTFDAQSVLSNGTTLAATIANFASQADATSQTVSLTAPDHVLTTTEHKQFLITIGGNQNQATVNFSRTKTTNLTTNQSTYSDWVTDQPFSSLTTDDGLTTFDSLSVADNGLTIAENLANFAAQTGTSDQTVSLTEPQQFSTTTQHKQLTIGVENNQSQVVITFSRTKTTNLTTNQSTYSDWVTDQPFSSLTTDDGLTTFNSLSVADNGLTIAENLANFAAQTGTSDQTVSLSEPQGFTATTQHKQLTVGIENNQNQVVITFSRTKTTNLTTNQSTYSDWVADQSFSSLTTDDGLTTFDAQSVTADGMTLAAVLAAFANQTNTASQTITLTEPQHLVTTTQHKQLTITLAGNRARVTLYFTRIRTTDLITHLSTYTDWVSDESFQLTSDDGQTTFTLQSLADNGLSIAANIAAFARQSGTASQTLQLTNPEDQTSATVIYTDPTTQQTVTSQTLKGAVNAPIVFTTVNHLAALQQQGYQMISDETALPQTFTRAQQVFHVTVKKAAKATPRNAMQAYQKYFPTSPSVKKTTTNQNRHATPSHYTTSQQSVNDLKKSQLGPGHQQVVFGGAGSSHASHAIGGGNDNITTELGQFFVSLSGTVNFGYVD